MLCEIEFLPVGAASKAGDAIIIRYGYPFDYRLMLIDAGHADTGSQIVAHLHRQFGPNVVLEHAVLTHSDGDHASGLRTVLQEVPVRNMWLHAPWILAADASHLFLNKSYAPGSLGRIIRAEYPLVSEIFELAAAAGCAIRFPFAGQNIGPFHVCSPSSFAYQHLLPQFEKTPAPDQQAIEAAHMWIGKESFFSKWLDATMADAHDWTEETWEGERLRDGGVTSASNESSVVLYGAFAGGERVLLTGDAGPRALWWTANYADFLGLPLRQFTFVQIPHHGSRRNVGPMVLDRLLGPKRLRGLPPTFRAYVSAPADDTRHPRRMVLNAFRRRGGRILATQGSAKLYGGGFPLRPGYVAAEELPFYRQVEEYT